MKEKNSVLTVGQLNKIIDTVLHPMAKKNPELWILDSLLHAIVESSAGQDPAKTLIKFLRYNFPKIAEMVINELEKYQKD